MSDHVMPELQLSGQERARTGLIVTCREQTTGRLDTMHVTGPVRSALAEVCDRLEAREGEWRVVSVSTPASIFRDLQGLRGESAASEKYRQRAGGDPRSTEGHLLGAVGRLDLLEPLRTPGPDLRRGRLA